MKLCKKCKGYGYLTKHRNKPLRMCEKCNGWGKTDGYTTNERNVENSKAIDDSLKNDE